MTCPVALIMLLFRLEALNEARQGQVNRVKIVEKEREGLEGEKMAAEAYIHKDAERLGTQSKIFQRFMSDGQVGALHAQALVCVACSLPSNPQDVSYSMCHSQAGMPGQLICA